MLGVMPGTDAPFTTCVLKVRESYVHAGVEEVIKTWVVYLCVTLFTTELAIPVRKHACM